MEPTELALIVAAFILQGLVHQLELRRYLRREAEYLKQIRSLENRIHAKDINTYVGLEGEDAKRRSPPPKPKRETVPHDDGRYFQGNGTYDDPEETA